MNFNIFKRNKHKEERALTYYSDALNFNNYSSFSANYAMRLSAVYRAVELISDSVAMLPIYVQFEDSDGFKTRYTEHNANKLLNNQPNSIMTRYQFIKLLLIDVMLREMLSHISNVMKREMQQNLFIYVPIQLQLITMN